MNETQLNSVQGIIDPSSFRDPSGFVFTKDDQIFRQINKCYESRYAHFMSSGLYNCLLNESLIVPHEVVKGLPLSEDGYLVIMPRRIPFISYPYEWCFGQLKDAALVTLRAHRRALDFGMILKDASTYNVQFVNGQALLIDTLSFEMYSDGMPWIAYGQFCRHFLAPLYLMVYADIRLSQLLRIYIDGVPLDLASKLLHGKGGMSARQHIHWHSSAVEKHGNAGKSAPKEIKISKFSHTAMIDSLIRAVEKLTLKGFQSEWGDYYSRTNYSNTASRSKASWVSAYLSAIKPRTVWDFGANDGTYSRMALKENSHIVAFDIDFIAVERNYTAIKKSREPILPLILDLTNPSPAIGFANIERSDISRRQKPDCLLALALIHHLAISNNLPLEHTACWLASLCHNLIIEFVPKEDSQVKILLATRDDIFTQYTKDGFEKAFSRYFVINESNKLNESSRILYRMHAIK